MPVRSERRPRYRDTPLQSHEVGPWKDGYNSFARSQAEVKDTEVPRGQDCHPDDNGAMADRDGKVAASPAFPSGYPTAALGTLKTASLFKKLALHGPTLYAFDDSTLTALTGATFTPTDPKHCKIFQAAGRAYVVNGIDQPYYTTDGATLTMQAGAFPMRNGTFYNQRIYCTRPQYPDRIYFSNPLSVDDTSSGTEPAGYEVGDFGTFAVDLSADPVKNAGYVSLGIESGVEVVALARKGDVLWAYTSDGGEWTVRPGAVDPDSNVLSHEVQNVIASGGTDAPLSVFPSENDQLFFGGDNVYFLGEVALYQSQRVSVKSARIQSDVRAIPASLKDDVVGISFQTRDYVFGGFGAFNDRTWVRNRVLNSWSAPFVGWNVSCALVVKETDGTQRLLAGSSDPDDPYVYELEQGSTDAGQFIDARFFDKNTDLKHPGIRKTNYFSKVFFSSVTDGVGWRAYVDGVLKKSGTFTVPRAGSSEPAGTGTQPVGLFLVGIEGDSPAVPVPTATDGTFTINHGGIRGERLQVEYFKSSLQSRFRILRRKTWHKPGKPTPN
jgi:hypothetical protein